MSQWLSTPDLALPHSKDSQTNCNRSPYSGVWTEEYLYTSWGNLCIKIPCSVWWAEILLGARVHKEMKKNYKQYLQHWEELSWDVIRICSLNSQKCDPQIYLNLRRTHLHGIYNQTVQWVSQGSDDHLGFGEIMLKGLTLETSTR